jgi:hypothetical protein
LGYAKTNCITVALLLKEVEFSCPYGVVGEILDFGVNVLGEVEVNTCITTAQNRKCTPTSTDFIAQVNNAVG